MVAIVNPSQQTAVLDRVTVQGGAGLTIGAARLPCPDRADYQTPTRADADGAHRHLNV